MNNYLTKFTKDRQGFTLIEVFIAILIFALVISALFSSFKAFIISSEGVKETVAQSERMKGVYRRISLDMESIFVLQPPRYKKPEFNSDPDPFAMVGSEETVGQQVVSYLIFTSFAHAKIGEDQRDGIARIGYYVKENNDDTYDLYRSDTLLPFPEELESCTDPVLIQGISGFEIRYFDTEWDEYKYWDSDDSEYEHTFPLSIEMRLLSGFDEDQKVTVFTFGLQTGREPIE